MGFHYRLPAAPPVISVTMIPNNPPIRIPAGGGSFGFEVSIENNCARQVTFDGWFEAALPNGRPHFVALRPGIILNGRSSVHRGMTQYVPAAAPIGNYSYKAFVGVYPDSAVDSAAFTFTKLAGDGPPNNNSGWGVCSWFSGEEAVSIHHSSFIIHPCIPNPFNATTDIRYQLQAASLVKLAVYDITGREVARLVDGWYPAGNHSMIFDEGGLPSGVYFARFKAENFTQTIKLLLMK